MGIAAAGDADEGAVEDEEKGYSAGDAKKDFDDFGGKRTGIDGDTASGTDGSVGKMPCPA